MHENGKLKDKIYAKLDDEIQNVSSIFFNKLKVIQTKVDNLKYSVGEHKKSVDDALSSHLSKINLRVTKNEDRIDFIDELSANKVKEFKAILQ